MSPDDRLRIRHMVEAMEAARSFIDGRVRADLDTDRMLLFALIRAVEVVGEAASKITEGGRAELPTLPWQQIVGMRNPLIHAYFDINRNILWDTVTLALPPLLATLKAVSPDA
jgi:uncharacterized protein with HEPN domain